MMIMAYFVGSVSFLLLAKISTLNLVFSMFLGLFHMCIIMSPVVLFLLIYGEITAQLIVWCVSIKDDVSINSTTCLLTHIRRTKNFIEALRNISNLFSYFLFWILVESLSGLTFGTYRSISFVLGNYSKDWQFLCMSITFFVMSLSFVQMIWYLCSFSQLLATKIHELKYSIMDLSITMEDQLVHQINETTISSEKESVYLQLNDFKGFNAEDFFTVNNSLITGMTSHFVTFLIILIEFKFTEMSLNKN